jgi:hypothetical protein
MRYGTFPEYAGYSADMRNTFRGIHLWPTEYSDHAADTRKLNAINELRPRRDLRPTE